MASKPSNNKGTTKAFSNGSPEEAASPSVAPKGSSQAIGTIKGRLTFSKSKVADLNRGAPMGGDNTTNKDNY